MSVPTVPKEQLVDAIISNVLLWKNPYDIFDAKADTPVEEIHRKYKKLSLQIHPDKCHHPQAREAFDTVQRAMNILKEEDFEELRKKYQKVMMQARDKMRVLWLESGKERKTAEDDKVFDKDCRKMTQKILLELEETNKRAEDLKRANEQREKEEAMREQEKVKKEKENDEKWEAGRDVRVSSWRDFQAQTKKRKENPDDEPLPPPVDDSPIVKPLKPPPVIFAPAPPSKTEPKPKSILEPEKKKKKYMPKPLKPPRIRLG